MKTFKEFCEAKNKLHLGLELEGEPVPVTEKPKKGKLKMTLDDEGEPVIIKK